MARFLVLCLSTLVILLVQAMCADVPRVDPETGAIRLLFIGDSFMSPGFPTPYFVDDPRIDVTPVPSEIAILGGEKKGTELAMRYYRMYLPRTQSALFNSYDEVIIADAQSGNLRNEFQLWVKNAVIKAGLGLMMVDGPASFGGVSGGWGECASWGPTPVGDILPVECMDTRKDWSLSKVFRLVAKDPNHPIFKGLPWKTVYFYAHNRVLEREGAQILATMSDNPQGSPFIASWDPGKGRSVALVFDWGGNGVTDFYRWPYCPDFLSRMVYYPVKVPIPQDLDLDHLVRMLLSNYRQKRLYAISVMEFTEKFGANSRKLYDRLKEIDTEKKSADVLYRRMNLEGAKDAIKACLDKMSVLANDAIRAKDRALLWIYVVEWCAVTGTALAAGAILYTVMIRRRLYKEVHVTRAA